MVQSIKTQGMKSFGDYADEFVKTVLRKGSNCCRIDIVFDRYRDHSIKSGTRKRRTKGFLPVRRVIENRVVPLPSNFGNFLSLPENKKDLAALLAKELIQQAPYDKIIVTAGGYPIEDEVRCNDASMDLSTLMASHEEADTRIVLHAVNCTHVSACVQLQF